jgi:hypothetical protein
MYIQVCGLVLSTLGLERRSLVRFRLMGRPLYIGLYGGEAGCLHLYHPAHVVKPVFILCQPTRREFGNASANQKYVRVQFLTITSDIILGLQVYYHAS